MHLRAPKENMTLDEYFVIIFNGSIFTIKGHQQIASSHHFVMNEKHRYSDIISPIEISP